MANFPFDVVAFDLDGTLADTAPDLAALDVARCYARRNIGAVTEFSRAVIAEVWR